LEPPAPPVEVDSSAALVQRLRDGDDCAYAELLRDHGPRLLATARRLLRDEEEARDTLQDAFLQAFRHVGEFRGEAGLGTWLHRITVNAALARLRARKRRPEEESLDAMLPGFSPGGHFLQRPGPWTPLPEEEASRAEVRERVRAAIDALPEGHRTVLVLRDIEGLSTEDAAAALDITVSAAKVRLHRARQALRERLDPSMRKDHP
jgi:RNA polymerase sigma-70 factor (ECF subfamily)